MDTKIILVSGWDNVKKAALYTVGKTKVVNKPTKEWIFKMLQLEHSPIREYIIHIEVKGIKYWIANHLRTHFIGCNSYISTSREDRNDKVENRDELPQGDLVNCLFSINAQELINISRKRLCMINPHPETRVVWQTIVNEIIKQEPLFEAFLKPECFYRNGYCPDGNNCFKKTFTIKNFLKKIIGK